MNKLLRKILNTQSYSGQEDKMIDLITVECTRLGCQVVVKDRNVYVTKGSVAEGQAYPCIVAHTDTVHRIVPDEQYRVATCEAQAFGYNPVSGMPTGIGGDDKCGIYVGLRLLAEQPVLKAFFPHSEEIGCVGSGAADMKWFKDVGYALQCDRRGSSDFVANIYGEGLYTDEFSDAIAPMLADHGYEETEGAMTDVYQLALNGLGVCVANMSAGYYNPHSANEYVHLQQLDNALSLTRSIVERLGATRWEIERGGWQDAPYGYGYDDAIYDPHSNCYWKRGGDGEWQEVGRGAYATPSGKPHWNWEADDDQTASCEGCGCCIDSRECRTIDGYKVCGTCYDELVGVPPAPFRQ